MAIIGTSGIHQRDTVNDLLILSESGITIKAATGKTVKIVNPTDSSIFVVDEYGNTRIYGDLTVDGAKNIIHSTEVNIGDSEITLNAEIVGVTQNNYGGITIKRTSNAVAAALATVSFTASTRVIRVSTDPAVFLAVADLFYVKGSTLNDGLYKVQAIDSTVGSESITVDNAATEYGVKAAIVDETTTAAKVSEAIPAYMNWNEAGTRWEFGYYTEGAVKKNYKAVGIGAGGAVAYADANPDISVTGTNNTNSGAAKVGIYDEFGYTSATNVQDAVDDLDAELDNVYAEIGKNGQAALGNNVDELTITFAAAFTSIPGSITCTIENTDDTTPLVLIPIVIDKTVSDFKVKLSGLTDSTNYKVNWIARKV